MAVGVIADIAAPGTDPCRHGRVIGLAEADLEERGCGAGGAQDLEDRRCVRARSVVRYTMPRGFAGGLLLLREGGGGVDGVIDSRATGFWGTGSLVRRGLAVGALRSTVREADATGEGDATTDPLSPLFSVVAVTATPRTSDASSKPLNGAWTQRVRSCCGNGHDPRECVVQPLSTKADSSNYAGSAFSAARSGRRLI